MKILFLNGMARSGTSWLGKIFASHPRVLYHPHAFYNRQGTLHQKDRQNLQAACVRLWEVRDHRFDVEPPFFPQPSHPELMVLKDSHLAQEPRLCGRLGKVLFIIRDPRAQINSLLNHSEFGKDYGIAASAEHWITRNALYLELVAEYPAKYQMIKYEDLLASPMAVVARLFDWADVSLERKTEEFVVQSHSRQEDGQNTVFKDPAEVNIKWRRELSPEAINTINRTVRGSKAAALYKEL